MISKDDVMEAFAMLHKAREEAYQAARGESEAKYLLKDAEYVALVHGEGIDGKNKEQRDAQLAFIVDAETLVYQESRDKNAFAELALEQAKDRCKCAGMLIELMKMEGEA